MHLGGMSRHGSAIRLNLFTKLDVGRDGLAYQVQTLVDCTRNIRVVLFAFVSPDNGS